MSKACQMLHNEKENLLTQCVTPASIKLSQWIPMVYLKMGSLIWYNINDENITSVKNLHNH